MQESEKKGFFEGGFGKYLLPGILLQSVLIGGGYATGREIVSYGAKYGAKGWTLIETSTGVIHALMGRVNVEMTERGKEHLSRKQQAIVTVVILVASCVMAKFGIIALIEKGYTVLSYGFMLMYMLPILTVGVYKILKKDPILKNAGGSEMVLEDSRA